MCSVKSDDGRPEHQRINSIWPNNTKILKGNRIFLNLLNKKSKADKFSL